MEGLGTNTVRLGSQVLDSVKFSGVHLLGNSISTLVRVTLKIDLSEQYWVRHHSFRAKN